MTIGESGAFPVAEASADQSSSRVDLPLGPETTLQTYSVTLVRVERALVALLLGLFARRRTQRRFRGRPSAVD